VSGSVAVIGLGIVGLAAGWVATTVAARVLAAREEDLPPMPGWAWPVVAAATALVFPLIGTAVDGAALVPAYVCFGFVTMTLVVTDVHSRLIPDRISYPGTYVATGLLGVGAVIDGSADLLVRAAIGAVIYLALAFLLWLPGGGRNFGGGDVKLTPLLGFFTAFLGWDMLIVAIFLGVLIGGVVGILLVVLRARGLRDHFAFGPPLTLGAYVAIVWGTAIIDWYV
jgi:leader peptidase (prepilin peptidase)/N-methyltransferase